MAENQSDATNPSDGFKLEPDTRKSIEVLLKGMTDHGSWGYKSKTDPEERELALQSEGMAEKLFAYLYRDDPENAKKCWQDFTSKPADNGLIGRAKNAVLEGDKTPDLRNLQTRQSEIIGKVQRLTEDKDVRMRKKEGASLRIALGDTEQRKRDYRRRAMESLTPTERDYDGLTIVKAFLRGSTKISDDLHASMLEGRKGREIRRDIKHITGGQALTKPALVKQSVTTPVATAAGPSQAASVGAKMASGGLSTIASAMVMAASRPRDNHQSGIIAGAAKTTGASGITSFGGQDFGRSL